MTDDKRTKNEFIKEGSRQLRGTIAEGLADVSTGAISEDDSQLTKFHGTYLQDDRDVRPERAKKKLEKAYSFMIRVRLPGGVTTSKQWLALDAIAGTYANHTLRLTTRQTFQFHGVIKSNMKRTMQALNAALLDTLAACGDVNRNVLAASNPYLSKAHAAVHDLAVKVSEHLLPQTGAYHEIWLDGEQVIDETRPAKKDEEPIYGTHYLPRKFKIVIAVPPSNDVDIFAHDLGYIAIVEGGKLVGYNVTVGGGMGMTHGEHDTFPRTADRPRLLHARAGGRCGREGRHRAARLGQPREPQTRAARNIRSRTAASTTSAPRSRSASVTSSASRVRSSSPRPATSSVGSRAADKKWHLTLFIENGRIKDLARLVVAHGAARDRRGASGRLCRHRQPEPHHCQRGC